MTSTHHLRRLNALLEEALALPPHERAGWLEARPEADRPFMDDLRALVAHAAAPTGTFMREPAAATLDALAAADALPDAPGGCVGPYRLIEPLGEGGMATVWLAQRIDGTLAREVALKLPRLGYGKGLAQRMARERDLLAALEHPGIARLYDAGVTESGRPWLAMERVQGTPIDRYCRERRTDPPAVLRLVLQVCAALAHAHGRLIVHRDLKPANILVTADGEVRLLDFGVGKLLHDDEAPDPQLTQRMGSAHTPDYASPEQVAGKLVTVVTDVYSLGVVLYELLTGQRPYRLGRQSAAALEEAILGADVPPASSRATPRARAQALRGDLDAVLARAMHKEPGQRYPSMDALAADLRAVLERRPVTAQAPSWRYRAGKFLRRNTWPVALVSSTALALVSGLGIALWQWQAARTSAQQAVQHLVEAEAASDFASLVLTDAVRAGEALTLEQIVQRAEQMARQQPASNPTRQASAAFMVASWFTSYGAGAHAERLLTDTLQRLPANTAPSVVARLRCSRATALTYSKRTPQAVAELDEVIAQQRDPMVLSGCLLRRAYIARDANDAAGAMRFASAAMANYDASGRQSPLLRALIEAEVAFALVLNHQPAQAQQRYDHAMALYEAEGAAESPAALSVRNNRAVALISAGQHQQALVQIEAAIAAAKRHSVTGEPPAYLEANRGQTLRLMDRPEDALQAFGASAAIATRGGNDAGLAYGLAGQAACLTQLGRLLKAQAKVDESLAVLQRAAIASSSAPYSLANTAQAMLAQAQGRFADAERLLGAVQQRFDKGGNSGALLRLQRAELAWSQQRLNDAESLAAEALTLGRQAGGDFPHQATVGQSLVLQARLAHARGDIAKARELAQQGEQHLLATVGAQHRYAKEARALRTSP